jgi:hypothetical protein
MKKKAVYSILIILVVGIRWYFSLKQQTLIKEENNTLPATQKPSTMVIPIATFKLLFIESWAYIQDIHQTYNCATTINGSYFWTNEDDTFFPAGIRLQSWSNKGHENKDDPNLQEYLEIDEQQKSIIHIKPEQVWRKYHNLYINAGPLLINEGEINTGIDQDISHRKKPYPRTILVIAEDGQPFLYISPEQITLPQAAIQISNLKEYGKMTAINLDGWPSTAVYREFTGGQFFLENQLLPIFFCILKPIPPHLQSAFSTLPY